MEKEKYFMNVIVTEMLLDLNCCMLGTFHPYKVIFVFLFLSGEKRRSWHVTWTST